MKSATQNQIEPAIRILKIATCPSLSGKSKLTYHIGGSAESEVLFRVYANTAAGYFSKEWVALTSIQQLFGKAVKSDAITSFALMPLFKGKSINTPSFLFAALMNEGLVKDSATVKRCYECTDGKKFFAQVDALMASGVDLTDKLQKIAEKAVKEKQPSAATETKKVIGKSQSSASKAKPVASEKSTAPASRKAAKTVSPKAA